MTFNNNSKCFKHFFFATDGGFTSTQISQHTKYLNEACRCNWCTSTDVSKLYVKMTLI